MTTESKNNQLNQKLTEFSASDERYLRQAIVLSQQAGARGNRPFGAVIADARGELVAQAENDTITAHDCTGHAETNALRIACGKLDRAALAGCTLYASAARCAPGRSSGPTSGVWCMAPMRCSCADCAMSPPARWIW